MTYTFAGIDDSKTIRFIFKKAAKELGYDLILSEDGIDGYSKIVEAIEKGIKISIIISDINMPNMNGIELAKKLKSNPATKSIPLVFLTSETDKDLEIQSRILGAEGWLSKPLDVENVRSLVKRFTEG